MVLFFPFVFVLSSSLALSGLGAMISRSGFVSLVCIRFQFLAFVFARWVFALFLPFGGIGSLRAVWIDRVSGHTYTTVVPARHYGPGRPPT